MLLGLQASSCWVKVNQPKDLGIKEKRKNFKNKKTKEK